MYLPKHQYRKVESIDQPQLRDGLGNVLNNPSIIKTSAGEYFDVPPADLALGIFTNAVQGFPVPGETPQPVEELFAPTDRDKAIGKVKRYFVQNKSTAKVKEIAKESFDAISKNKQLYETIGTLEWQLQGPINDIEVQGAIFKGAATNNRAAVLELNKTIPGVVDIITSYTQFVQSTPADTIQESKVVPQKNSFNIPAPGKKL